MARRRFLSVTVAAAMVTALTLTAVPAHADEPVAAMGSISGTVRFADGSDPSAVLVDIFNDDGHLVDSVRPDSTGTYATDVDLPADDYKIRFDADDAAYITQWWNTPAHQSEPALVTLAPGQNATGIDATVEEGGTITGTVTDATGEHVSFAEFDLWDTAGNRIVNFCACGSSTSDAYTIEGIPTGIYYLEVTPGQPYAAQWYSGSATLADATPIAVAAGQVVSGKDFTLERTGEITGTITLAGRPDVRGSNLTVLYWDASDPHGGESSFGATVGVYGQYDLWALAPGDYVLEFRIASPAGSAFAPERRNVTVAPGQTVRLDVTLQHLGDLPAISGTAVVGSTLAASAGDWPRGMGFAYAWFADGSAIPDASGTTLVLAAAQLNKAITVTVTAAFPGYPPTYATSAATAKVAAGLLTSPTPEISGVAAVGQTLTALAPVPQPGVTYAYQWSAGGAPIPNATERTLVVTSAQENKTITVTVTASAPGYQTTSASSSPTQTVAVVPPPVTVPPQAPVVPTQPPTAPHQPAAVALAGADRYGTAIAISKDSYPKAGTAKTVVITSGENFPDALSAAPAAVKLGGPLLLTPHDRLPAAVAAELRRLRPQRIVVAGGTVAVSAAVLSSLNRIAPTTRVSGADRYATSLAIAKYAFGSKVPNAYFATGASFADALSASAAAGAQGMPVLLVPGSATRPSAPLLSWLKSTHITRPYVVGGSAAISQAMNSALVAATGHAGELRAAGADRFDTNRLVNSRNSGYAEASTAYLASGMNFPDALAGAAAAGKAGAPLYLSRPNCVPAGSVKAIRSAEYGAVKRLGGAAALGSGVANMTPCT